MEDALRRYFAELLFFTILPIVIIVVLVLLYFIRTCLFRADSKRCRDQTILVMLLAVYVLLPPIATTIFRGIPCDDDFGGHHTVFIRGPRVSCDAHSRVPSVHLYNVHIAAADKRRPSLGSNRLITGARSAVNVGSVALEVNFRAGALWTDISTSLDVAELRFPTGGFNGLLGVLWPRRRPARAAAASRQIVAFAARLSPRLCLF